MKNFSIIYTMAMAVILLGCNQIVSDELNQPPSQNNSRITSGMNYKPDIGLIKEIAQNFVFSDSAFLNARRDTKTNKVKDIKPMNNTASDETECYLVNYDEGFAIISGDLRLMPIIAYSPSGDMKEAYFNEVNGLSVWYQDYKMALEEIKNEESTPHEIVLKEWDKYLSEDDTENKRLIGEELAYMDL